MRTITPCEERSTEIAMAVRLVYEQAALLQDAIKPQVVQLRRLIDAYPIRVEPLRNLTYKSAARFLVKEIGQDIPVPESEDKLAGFLCVCGGFNGCILVEESDPVARQRFSVAHELGHYLLHFLPLLELQNQNISPENLILSEGLTYGDTNETTGDIPSGELTFTGGVPQKKHPLTRDTQQMEIEANQFAAELLMPAPACQALAKRYSRRFGTERSVLAKRLATEFLVSWPAMKRRLTDLGLPEKLADSDAELS